MADHTVEVTIVTPDGSVYDRDDATMVIVKTGGGEMGILASHQPFVATLEIDAVRIQTGDKEDHRQHAKNDDSHACNFSE